MMQARWLAKLGRDVLSSSRSVIFLLPSRCLAASAFSTNPIRKPVSHAFIFTARRHSQSPGLGFYPTSPFLQAIQARLYAAEDRSRAPLKPVKSKVKKYKLKSYSSFKFRFRTMNDGQIRRWRAGKRHNAHLKTKKAKRRLRKPAIVHLAYAKVLKKLNFCG
ncbi:uncharacterized protein LOC122051990 isoform X1 [Zingiber officinale]|uniref:50S ribosomal protein L35 n=1 Tax=Zingiber officinale TaxID=94328 RepID=A0A8J5H6A9_ZINOF|nr:uncharacterized protein LOC122051990 isoform X1 [Zingiber officinale]XP_042469289.1 uncharacterized protein LOC122051990 isoform X1 [Zingiber officinale]XP_042469291.1 uncharacterized protein LOC122051990 isoform X1 [Zingiber officinale]KAG6521259.1 hypothetical protein ZIOFF_018370 [Zingiber officinale]